MAFFDSSFLKGSSTRYRTGFQRYHDKSQEFLKMLMAEHKNPESSFIAMIIGATGSGKTALSFIIINVLLLTDSSRICQMFRVPPILLELIKASAPEHVSSRFEVIENLRDIRENSIVLIDEGLLNANAKEALKLEFRAFEKGLGTTRHMRIVTLMNTQSDGILKSYRKLAHMVFFKRISILMQENSDMKFIKQNSYTLQKLTERQLLFMSGYKQFNGYGRMTFNLEKLVPWYNIRISKSYAKQCFDQQFEQERKKDQWFKELALEAVDFWGEMVLQAKSSQMIAGWISEQLGYDVYFDVRTKIKEIMKYAVYFLRLKQRNKKKGLDKEEIEIINADGDFAEFCRTQFATKDKLKSEMVFLFVSGSTQREIASQLKKKTGWINTQILNFREKEIGYLFEQWFAMKLGGGRVGGTSHEPDYIDKNGDIYSLKCYYDISNAITKYQQADSKPEYTRAKQQNRKYYWVINNLGWRDGVLHMIECDPNGDEKIVFRKDENQISMDDIMKMMNDKYADKIIPEDPKLATFITNLTSENA